VFPGGKMIRIDPFDQKYRLASSFYSLARGRYFLLLMASGRNWTGDLTESTPAGVFDVTFDICQHDNRPRRRRVARALRSSDAAPHRARHRIVQRLHPERDVLYDAVHEERRCRTNVAAAAALDVLTHPL